MTTGRVACLACTVAAGVIEGLEPGPLCPVHAPPIACQYELGAITVDKPSDDPARLPWRFPEFPGYGVVPSGGVSTGRIS